MDVVRSFVGLDRLEVAHVPKDRVLVGDAIGPQQITGPARDFQRYRGVIAFDHRDVGVVLPALVLQARDMQRDELRLGDFSDHPGEFVLN